MRYHRLPHRRRSRGVFSAALAPSLLSRTGASTLWCLRVSMHNKQQGPFRWSPGRPGPSRSNLSGRGNGGLGVITGQAARFRIGDF